jgi:hypothetical protein
MNFKVKEKKNPNLGSFSFLYETQMVIFQAWFFLKDKLLGFQCVENHSLSCILWQWKFLNIAK